MIILFPSWILTAIAYRLNSSTPNLGRVEVRVNGEWGTICNRYWDRYDAGVLCRSQGFSDGDPIPVPEGVAEASGPVWSANLRCSGNETELNDCLHQGWLADTGYYCSDHTHDVGAFCYSNGEQSAFLQGFFIIIIIIFFFGGGAVVVVRYWCWCWRLYKQIKSGIETPDRNGQLYQHLLTLVCHCFTRAIPKGLTFGLCLYVLRLCNMPCFVLYSNCARFEFVKSPAEMTLCGLTGL